MDEHPAMKDEKNPPEQIPWSKNVKVTYQSNSSIALRVGTASVDVYHRDFEWNLTIDSMAEIEDYMKVDEKLTASIRQYFEEYERPASYQDKIRGWLNGISSGDPERRRRRGPKDWSPNFRRKRQGKILSGEDNYYDSVYGYGNTYNEDSTYFLGDTFEYAHIETADEREGAIIMWNTGGGPMGSYLRPTVYIGNFSEFMELQREDDPHGYETLRSWNDFFEGGIFWGWEKLGAFDEPDAIKWSDHEGRQVASLIKEDPGVLMPESVEKILQNIEEFPKAIQEGVRWLMMNKRLELERALGQKLIWEDLYARE
jgi:hypothetical protein